MKIFTNAYINKNLGDDLFIKILSERYKNHVLYLPKSILYLNISNAKYYEVNILKKYIFNIFKMLSLGKISLQSYYQRDSNISVTIGGSMYMERNSFKSKLSEIPHPPKYDYIIGINFGPYNSRYFYKKYYNYFSKTKDVCFRDKYSYELFKDIKHCRYAPDIVFSLDTSKYTNNNSKRVIISVIDCDKRFSSEIADNYYNKIVEIINFYKKSNYKICLMSFCRAEGDEEAIKKILQRIDDKSNIETYYYDGNIDEALNNIGNSSIVVGTRFHANILGMVFRKKVIPISYSDKTVHMLEDIGFDGVKYDIRNMDDFDISKLKNINNNTINIDNLKKESLLHFRELDKILK